MINYSVCTLLTFGKMDEEVKVAVQEILKCLQIKDLKTEQEKILKETVWPYFRHAMENHYCTGKQFLFKELCSKMTEKKISFAVRYGCFIKIRSYDFPLFQALKLHSRLLWKYNASAAQHTCVNT